MNHLIQEQVTTINLFLANIYPLKTIVELWFSVVLRGHETGKLTGLNE